MINADTVAALAGAWPEVHALTFERSEDWQTIKEIATHPRIYPFISDDFAPPREEWEPIQSEQIWYVVIKDNGELLGMFALAHANRICWQVHTCLLPHSWGTMSKRAAKECIEWVWGNSCCVRLVTEVPAYNRIALKFAKDSGMTEYGINPKAYQHFGKLWDVHLLGISKCL